MSWSALTRVAVAMLAAGPMALMSAATAIGSDGLAGETKRVLIIETFSRDFAPLSTFTPRFKTRLAETSPSPVEFYETNLGAVPTGSSEAEAALKEYLRALYAGRPPDLIVPVGQPAARFWWRHRDAVFPATPVVLGPIAKRVLSSLPLGPNDSAVAFEFDARSALENILQTLPATTNIAVVIGDSPLERFWAEELLRDWEPLTNRVHFQWFNRLPFAEMVLHAAALPPRSAVLYAMLFVDAAGVPHEQERALEQFCAEANAPVFGVFEQHLGHGVTGGIFLSGDELGRRTASMAARVLSGESPGAIPPQVIGPTPPTYDWRQMERWRISERQLPPGSVVRFRPPSAWERYRWHVLGALAIMVAQAATITALALQHAARRRAEAAAYEVSGQLITAQEEERRRIARDLHDELNQRLALLSVELDLARLADGGSLLAPKLEEMAGQVRDLSTEVHQLSHQLHPAKLDHLGLVAAARALSQEMSAQSDVRIGFTHDGVPEALSADTALCVFRVLQESLRNALRHSGATDAHVDLRVANRHDLILVVSDNGRGFDPARAEQGGGLGLLSMRERARLVHGRLAIRSAPGHGARVELTVPLGSVATERKAAS